MLTRTADAAGSILAAWRWRSRVLLVFAPDAADPLFRQQIAWLSERHTDNVERDLVPIRVVGNVAQSDDGAVLDAGALRRAFDVGAPAFAAILVGKDGGEKLRSAEPLPPDRLFRTIDGMPMRRREASRPLPRE